MREGWRRIYEEAPEVFAAFCAAEDPEGRIPLALQACAGLEDQEVLEIGGGTGRFARRLAPSTRRFVVLEPSRGLGDLAKADLGGATFVAGRGEAMPFPAGSFDRLLATWVLGYLPPPVLDQVLAEGDRVLRADDSGKAGWWVVENGAPSAFQTLRGVEGLEPGTRRLMEEHGFRVVQTVDTEIRFPDGAEALRILGALCGEGVAAQLRAQPQSRFSHRAMILHRGGIR